MFQIILCSIADFLRLFIFILFALVIWAIIRYRYLTTYSRLPPEVLRQEPKIDLFMDSSPDQDSKSGFSTYLEDFFSAIKIFGYLERSVFHELTRQMQTYKLEPGEVFPMNGENDFSVVVDGTLQIFTKSKNPDLARHSSTGSTTINGESYELVNEVKRGAPVSSLFTVLLLFTDSLKASSNDPARTQQFNASATTLNQNLSQDFISDTSSSSDGLLSSPSRMNLSDAQIPMDAGDAARFRFHLAGTVARAVEETTIAMIPKRTFHKLVSKYPKSTTHIVQVILTRLSRVTFQTGHNYLGLTPEIFETEIILNNRATYELPPYLRDLAVKGINEYLEAHPDSKEESFVYLAKDKSSRYNIPNYSNAQSRQVSLQLNRSHPGDLLSNVPLSRTDSSYLQPENFGIPSKRIPFSADEETEDSALRVAVTECIFKVLGLDNQGLKTEDYTSVAASPMMSAVDDRNIRHHRNSFSNVITNLSKIEDLRSVNDDESVSSVNLSSHENAQIEAAKDLEIIYYKPDSILVEQNGESHGLFFVIDGILDVGYRDKHNKYHELYTVKPGGLAGFIASVLSSRSFVEVRAKTGAYVGFLPQSTIDRICEKYPLILLGMAYMLTSSLSDLMILLDFALEWVQIPGGHMLFNEGDPADSIYIVLNGRLRSFVREGTNLKVHSEYGQGESIGELEVLTASKRPYSLHAIRETELAKFPLTLFENLAKRHPSTTIEISRIVASRVLNRLGAPSLEGYEAPPSTNFRTVSIIPITEGLPVSEFATKLFTSYKDIGHQVFSLNIATVLHKLGRNAFNKIGGLKLSGYLADLEERYQTVMYVADVSVSSPWTHTCIAQADCILLLADASAQPDVGEFERLLVTMKTTAKTELIFLHHDRYVVPGSTAKWLKNRIWVNSHHHVQMDFARNMDDNESQQVYGRLSVIRSKVKHIQSELITKYRRRGMPVYANNYVHKSDFARLARILSGQAVGLVLGGGGARGISHIGVIRALEESGIPIDYVGGTSIGSFVGGLYARDYDMVPIYGRAKQFASRISSLWRMVFDLTYPATSYTTGHEFNRGIWKAFGESQIEDFWLRYFTNTTNITHSRMEIHQSGYAWRYIRASMSLAGLLPPLTDKGSMLLDGGYVDNLPVEQMRSWGAKYIFAVDVGSIDDTTPMTYGDTLSGLWVLMNRWNFFSRHPNVPNLAEIQQRLAYVSSVGALEKAKAAPGVYYLRPPIDNYATLDFGKFDEIYRVGTLYGHQYLYDLKRQDKFPQIPGAGLSKGKPRKTLNRRNSI